MSTETDAPAPQNPDALLVRVSTIFEEARSNAVRPVNAQMTRCYWLIGREIENSQGDAKAIQTLSQTLSWYGNGFSVVNLEYFRQFYLAYPDRLPTSQPPGDDLPEGFSPALSWAHYRALIQVENRQARDFYEREAVECGWSKEHLRSRIRTFYYDRVHHGEPRLAPAPRKGFSGEIVPASDVLASPLTLEFLGLPPPFARRENPLDQPTVDNLIKQAILDNLQHFLLELGKGFSFVGRKKRVHYGDDEFYIDLVFYHYVLKCFLLVDLKMAKLTPDDVRQMDDYMRLYEDHFKIPGDNPTIGLLLCSERGEAMARYSVLNENKQVFATQYLPNLPTEEQMRRELERERLMIERPRENRLYE